MNHLAVLGENLTFAAQAGPQPEYSTRAIQVQVLQQVDQDVAVKLTLDPHRLRHSFKPRVSLLPVAADVGTFRPSRSRTVYAKPISPSGLEAVSHARRGREHSYEQAVGCGRRDPLAGRRRSAERRGGKEWGAGRRR